MRINATFEPRQSESGDIVSIGDFDVTEREFWDRYGHDSEEFTLPVRSELDKLMEANWVVRRDVEHLAGDFSANRWTGVGVIFYPIGEAVEADVTKDDYGLHTHGNGHLCEIARLVSNGQAIEEALKAADAQAEKAEDGDDRERWFSRDSMFFFDLGSVALSEAVVRLEQGLSEYALLDDDAHSELEDEMGREVFGEGLPRNLGGSIDTDKLEELWKQENSSNCPECGWEKDADSILNEHEDFNECAECGEWYDTEEDDGCTERHCGDCASERTERAQEADDITQDLWDFEVTTGEGVVIRWTDGYYYQWISGQWVKTALLSGRYILNTHDDRTL
jgi:hypothetical protein